MQLEKVDIRFWPALFSQARWLPSNLYAYASVVQEAIRGTFVNPPPRSGIRDWPQFRAKTPMWLVSDVNGRLFTTSELRSVGKPPILSPTGKFRVFP